MYTAPQGDRVWQSVIDNFFDEANDKLNTEGMEFALYRIMRVARTELGERKFRDMMESISYEASLRERR